MLEPLVHQNATGIPNTGPASDAFARLTHVVVLGSTGSIGQSALDVIEYDGGKRLKAWGLSAFCRWQALAEQAAALRPRFVAVADRALVGELERSLRRHGRRSASEARTASSGWFRTPRPTACSRRLSVRSGCAARGRHSRPARSWRSPTRRRWSSRARWSWSWPGRGARGSCRSTASTRPSSRPCRPGPPERFAG